MADFRKQAKDNPLKPGRVSIPQLDPLATIDTQNEEPKQTPRKAKKEVIAPTLEKVTHIPEPPQESNNVDSYKGRYLLKEEEKVTKTFRMYKWRYEQLEKEVRETGLSQWQVIDVGLEMYFRDKQSKQ